MAEREAHRFLVRLRELREVIGKNQKGAPHGNPWWSLPVIESGALRRASLDLTRALAKMRRP